MDPRPDGPIDWDDMLWDESDPTVEGRRLEMWSAEVPLHHVDTIAEGLDMGGNGVDYHGYDLVVSCEAYPNPSRVIGYEGIFIHLPLEDSDGDFNADAVKIVAGIVSVVRDAGKNVLVHCTAGLNRSGLVVATALIANGYTADQAIELIRQRRDHWALCNDSFCAFLQGIRSG